MELDEAKITKAVVKEFYEDLVSHLAIDVAVVGAGPAGMTAARYLAKDGFNVVVFERNLHVGGGMWGGGILFPKIVVQEEAKGILEEVGVRVRPFEGGLYVADAVEAVVKTTAATVDAGARIWVGFSVEDVVIRREGEDYAVRGVVINWRAVELAKLHVDPISIRSKVVIDATGHDAQVVRTLTKKLPEVKLPTRTLDVVGEKPMWAEVGEREILENTREVVPGLIVAGMAANAVFGSPRMGPIFGGMLLSGRRAAEVARRAIQGG